jgi:hypothetical protein
MKGYRKIVVEEETWFWKFGSSFVAIKDPYGKSYVVPQEDLFPGRDLERDKWKKNLHATPGDIKNYIMNLKSENRVDRVKLLKEVFRNKRYAEYAGGTLSVAIKEDDWKERAPKENSTLLLFNVGGGKTKEENCWIALNYIKYKKKGYFFDRAIALLKDNKNYEKLFTIALLSQ